MNRNESLRQFQQTDQWDVIIIGGGATGLGCAVDAASRGYKTLLLEQADFAKATSSRSTKLIHGGLRYLQQGDIALVMEALHERGTLCQNAPHLITHRQFLVPNYHWWEGPFYGIGLKVYDLLAGRLGIEKSRSLSKEETVAAVPNIQQDGLRGGTIYYDGQFDDARLAITLAQTATEHGGTLLNYMAVTGFVKEGGNIVGVHTAEREVRGKVVINATGIFVDEIRKLDDTSASPFLTPSQGIHLVLPKEFQGGETALLVPHTSDGRVLFFVPWKERLLIGTTDVPMKTPLLEPQPQDEEIDFILKHAAQYLARAPSRSDILSVFAGLRPLVNPSDSRNTKAVSRSHTITVSQSGLVTIAGGKWTTYRKMAEETIDRACRVGALAQKKSATQTLHLFGYAEGLDPEDHWSAYGSFAAEIQNLSSTPLHPALPYSEGEVIWAVRNEMAMHIEDVLARRTRSLLLDARASIEAAPRVAELLAQEHNFDSHWQKKEVEAYTHLAKGYVS